MSSDVLRSAVFRFFADESASVIAEYAIILATLSITCMVAFQAVSNSAATSVTTDTTGFTDTAATPP